MNTIKVKRIVQVVSVALACGVSMSALAADGVLFDQDGSGGGSNVSTVSKFDWGVGNVFGQASLIGTGAANSAPPGAATILIQEHLSAFVPKASLIQEFTFQLSVPATPTLTGDKLQWTDAGGAGSFFRIYAGGTTYNEITGVGYGAEGGAILILSGSVTIDSMSFTQDATKPIVGLDQTGQLGDNDNGVTSIQGNGSGTFNIDVGFAHGGYFLSDITSLTLDMNLTGSNSAPFDTGEPSDQVVGVNLVATAANRAAAYGRDDGDPVAAGIQHVNNYDCGLTAAGAPQVCGFHMQGDHSSTVFHTFELPEPGSLALLGMGLGLLGWRSRKWSQQS